MEEVGTNTCCFKIYIFFLCLILPLSISVASLQFAMGQSVGRVTTFYQLFWLYVWNVHRPDSLSFSLCLSLTLCVCPCACLPVYTHARARLQTQAHARTHARTQKYA